MKRDQKAKAKTIVLAIAVMMVFLPMLTMAGDLEPSASPASTMKTLNEIPPTWSQILDANDGTSCNSSRFVCVMNNEAVLDKETGLVWSKDADVANDNLTWEDAFIYTRNLVIGGRKGWRMPTVEELSSLIDPSQSSPALPVGHPFTDMPTGWHWTSTPVAGTTGSAWAVILYGNGSVMTSSKASEYYLLPVRSGNY